MAKRKHINVARATQRCLVEDCPNEGKPVEIVDQGLAGFMCDSHRQELESVGIRVRSYKKPLGN